MTFLNEIFKKLNEKSAKPTNPDVNSAQPAQTHPSEIILEALRETEKEALQSQTILSNLQKLNELMNQPKEEEPEPRFNEIKQYLGLSECHETVRQERWYLNIHCPKCRSTNLKRIPQVPSKSSHNHRYLCLECETEFNDDSGTPFEKGVPPLNTWMQCWYLVGCTDSIQYIAHKLGLELHTVEIMIRQLQKIFNAKKPLTHFAGYTEWAKQSEELRKQLKEDLLKQYERLNDDITSVPKNTEEYRRQQIRRRTLTTDTSDPTTRSLGKKR